MSIYKTGIRNRDVRKEAKRENEIVKASCPNNAPAIPCTNTRGTNTITVVNVDESMDGATISTFWQ